MDLLTYNVKSLLFGVAVGDALGVPVEFHDRESLLSNPVIDMLGYGTHNQPPGTYSDDSSLTFCLAEALIDGFDLNRIARNFVQWYYNGFWTPRGEVFDIGFTTQCAIERLAQGILPSESGSSEESSLGNGSLMRISPLVFYLLDKPIEERFKITESVSAITHGHPVAVLSCFYYLEFARLLLFRENKFEAYNKLQIAFKSFVNNFESFKDSLFKFDRLIQGDISKRTRDEILSTGYVIHTLEACIWTILTTDNFIDAVLNAVNLGDDTDTIGAITGGLAGILYGFDSIPKKWIKNLARSQDIDDLAERFANGLRLQNKVIHPTS